MNTIDTKYTYNSVPYNSQDQDKHPYNNRQALLPSYKYKQPRMLWLHSAFNSSQVSNGNTVFEITWEVPMFQIYNQTSVKVVAYITNEASAKPIIIKIKDLNVDLNSTYSSDRDGFPIIYANHTGVASQQYNHQFVLALLPQQINKITVMLNSSMTIKNQGFTINAGTGAGHFILGLLFEDQDLILDNAVHQYK